MSRDDMDLLLHMIHTVLIERAHFNGSEYDDAKWESTLRDGIRIYPCTIYSKLWVHFLTFYKILQQPDFIDSHRKIFLKDCINKTTTSFANKDGKINYVCTGPGVDSHKKSCSKTFKTILKSTWNAVMHVAHKHGIMYVQMYSG